MEPAQPLVVHPARHLGPPVVKAGEGPEAGARHEDVVEVGHHEVGVVELVVQGVMESMTPVIPPRRKLKMKPKTQ